MPEKVKEDNNCSFDKWLHEKINSTSKSSMYYDIVVYLHAEFHKEAGTILELALSGDVNEANERMKLAGKFSATSTRLVA